MGLTRACYFAVALCAAGSLSAQPPGIGQNGVVNAASRIPPTLPGGAIARGALFTVYGVRLAAKSTSVALKRPGVTLPIKILSQQPKRLEALMPMSAPLGSSSLVVTVDGMPSKPFPIEIAAFNPGIFARNQSGWGPGRIENIDHSGKRSANSPRNPARPGQKISFAATGLGGAKEVTVVVGNRVVKGTVANHVEEDQVSLTLPGNTPAGCWVPLYIPATPDRASNSVTISIRSTPGPCDSGLFPLWSSKKIILAALSRTRTKPVRPGQPDVFREEARIAVRLPIPEFVPPPHGLLPPPGTCSTSASSAQFDTDLSDSLRIIAFADAQGLDAGNELILSRDTPGKPETREVSESWQFPGKYHAYIGLTGMPTRRSIPGLFLNAGTYRLTSPGGPDVGTISMPFSLPVPFEWLDWGEKLVVNRSSGITLHWKNAGPDQLIAILASNVDQITTASAICLCTVRGDAGQFTIPAVLLGNFPVSIEGAPRRLDELRVASLSAQHSKSKPARGLDEAIIFTINDTVRQVEYR